MENSEPPPKRRRTRAVGLDEPPTSVVENNFSNDNEVSSDEKSPPSLRIGRIERAHLVNFMCHANFVVEFNKNINIFIGSNGSGKSAIITAVVIGLGGNAAIAERSQNLAQLIRRGESSASIEITLLNNGTDSYEHEKYGNRIIVHRQINASGTSQYRLKSESGVIVSRSGKDLQNMLMYMNVQMDNPICILNQDASRSFLKETNNRNRHLLFAKATQLAKIIEILDDTAMSYRTTKSRIPLLEQKKTIACNNYAETKNHYERLMSVETLKEELKNLKIELEWNNVLAEENKHEAIQKKLNEVDKKIDELKNAIENWSDGIKQLNEEKVQLLAECKNVKLALATNQTAHEILRITLNEKRGQLVEHQRQSKVAIAKLKRIEKDMEEMQESINNRQTSNRIELLKQENEEKLCQLVINREENQLKEEELKNEVTQLYTKNQEAESLLDESNEKRREVHGNVEKIKQDIKQINVTSSNNLSIFHKDMPKLIGALEKLHSSGLFSEMPRGPIGSYVQVKNKKWAQLVEQILGGHLQYFVFNSHADSKQFDNLIKREFPKMPKISKIVTTFCHTPYDVKSGKVQSSRDKATVLMDEITVSDSVVLNVLIDQVHIETILMCSSTAEATEYTVNESKVPKHLTKIVSQDPPAEYYPAPNFRSYGINLRPARLLQTDMKQYKVQLQQELATVTKELETVESERSKCQKEAKMAKTNFNEKRKNLSNIEKVLRKIENDIREIEEFEYPAQHEVDVLVNELEELKTEYDDTQAAIENDKENSDTSENLVKTIEKDIKTNRSEVKNLEKRLGEKLQAIDEITEKVDNLQLHNVEMDLKRCENEKKKLESEDKEQKEILNIATQKAMSKGKRIDNERQNDKIQNLIKHTENKIQKRCASTDDIDEVKLLMVEREKKLMHSEKLIKACNDIMTCLNASREARFSWLMYKFRPYIAQRVRKQFLNTLKLRNFAGKINIDHQNHTLDINIIPQHKHIPDAVSNTKSLSGGERSYSTLAFLTSLWSCVSSPFYFLDEYDVFTDQINRRFMAELLISEAKRRMDRQYCFFTPQDMSFVEAMDTVTFHKLESHLK